MDIISQLSASRDKTLPYFELDDISLSKSYAVDKWTVRQLLHHIADAETVLYDRIRRGIAAPKQVIWAFRQDDWAEKLEYEQRPLALNKAVYLSVRNAIIDLAQRYYEGYGANEFIHSETGLRTLKDEFDKVVWHNEHHLKQIQDALKES